MNTKVLGWYNHGNTGDEAYKLAFPFLFPDRSLSFATKIIQGEVPDAVILGGGDVCYPSFTRYINALPNSSVKVAASVTLTEGSDFESLAGFDAVFARDYRSVETAQRLDRAGNVNYLPDATFVLGADPQSGREWLERRFESQRHELYEKVVVCVISNYLAHSKLDMFTRDMTNFMYFSQKVAQIADDMDASFIFLPFSTKAPWDDRVSNGWVADRCKYYDKNLVIWEDVGAQTTLDIIACADACVSSRLHASIFSTIAGTPFVDITHHTKNFGYLETLGKLDWSIPYWEFDLIKYRNLLSQFIKQQNKDEYLLSYSQKAKEQLRVAAIL